ncbi:pimeloyl-ACP methyl ester carboxylesterase [Sphingomonas kyeonggiensis]|uniref:Pimeloyl-ACP methyl ester carboxylesterase n=1 Tax=Sphingomonas kyeonggiensis TaxID=1268553 RepID=A0A7W7JY50_9SPHN|nr:alpha/beta fold hydrolase [Sphingomonas kyeonggiensis]MBB4837399.1 pimeloyl-ACP methyl ester carboxylesterase [Sphingomonas kyeonggiensis]
MIPRTAADPPPRLTLAIEPARAALNIAELVGFRLAGLPRGDGRPVLVSPGLCNTDRSNFVLRAMLRRLGYRPYPWKLGRNFGVRTVGPECERLIARVEEIQRETGQKVTLVGVSLGGVMSRIVAHRHPELVRAVLTISSPFAGLPSATNVWRPFQLFTGEKITDPVVVGRLQEAARPLPMPSAAIWSRSDGFVNGLICREGEGAACRAIEVRSSHLFVQMKPKVLRAVAETLGSWI